MKTKKYTKEKIIAAIRLFFKEYGKVPTVDDFQINKKYPGPGTVIYYFGRWDNAIEAANLLDQRKRTLPVLYTEERLLECLRHNFSKMKEGLLEQKILLIIQNILDLRHTK